MTHIYNEFKSNNPDKPFSKSFVMRTTFRHMRRSVDISIRKSFERFADFDNDSKTGKEIMETLSVLHTVRKMFDDFQANNQELFSEKDKIE
jgi:hypothetical protein